MLEVEAVIQEVKTMVDGGFRLKVDTQELAPDQATKLFLLKGKFVKLTIEDGGTTN